MPNLALFDFDGTITSRELFGDFIRSAVTPGRLALGRVRLAPVVLGYKLGVVSATSARARIVDFAFRGRSESVVQDAGARFAQELVPTMLRPVAMTRIRWHQEQGDAVAVVSGGFDFYLSHWCRQHGLTPLCSQLEASEGVLTGRYLGAQCVGAEKVRRVREAFDLGRFAQVYAYGDTKEDMDLLAIADHRFYRWQALSAQQRADGESQ